MMESNGHVVLDVPYQGNGWWLILGIGSLFMLYRVLSGARKKRKTGLPIDTPSLIFALVFFLGFFVVALIQVLTHQ
jgi:hypothetical protein